MASSERWAIALSSETIWPPLYFVTGASDRQLADRKATVRALSSKGFEVAHKIVPSTGSMLLNEEGELEREVEEEIFRGILNWTK